MKHREPISWQWQPKSGGHRQPFIRSAQSYYVRCTWNLCNICRSAVTVRRLITRIITRLAICHTKLLAKGWGIGKILHSYGNEEALNRKCWNSIYLVLRVRIVSLAKQAHLSTQLFVCRSKAWNARLYVLFPSGFLRVLKVGYPFALPQVKALDLKLSLKFIE